MSTTPSKEAIARESRASITVLSCFVRVPLTPADESAIERIIQSAIDKATEHLEQELEARRKAIQFIASETKSRAAQPRCPRCGSKSIYIECHDPHTQCGAMIPAIAGYQYE
jgi:hypothetical protein